MGSGRTLIGLSPKASICPSRARSASRRGPGSDRASNAASAGGARPGAPTAGSRPRARRPLAPGQPDAPCVRRGRRATSAAVAPCARPRLAESLRSSRRPARVHLAPRPGASTSGGAVKIFFTSSGRVSITNGGEAGSLIVKSGPYRSRQCSINAKGRVQYPTAWISDGYLRWRAKLATPRRRLRPSAKRSRLASSIRDTPAARGRVMRFALACRPAVRPCRDVIRRRDDGPTSSLNDARCAAGAKAKRRSRWLGRLPARHLIHSYRNPPSLHTGRHKPAYRALNVGGRARIALSAEASHARTKQQDRSEGSA